MKKCNICEIEQDEANFYKLRAQCKDCLNKKRSEEYKQKSDAKDALQDTMKMCSCCEKEFPASSFKVNTSQCNDCRNEKKRAQRAKKRPPKPVPVNPDNKICKYCEKELEPDMFRHNRQKCKDCEKKDGRDYRQSDIGKTKAQTWAQENEERMAELQAKWFQENKEKINAKIRERLQTDIQFKLRRTVRNRIKYGLETKDVQKTQRTLEYVGCTIDDLMKWLSFCFTEDMTWENRSTYWHIDHVIPVNKFDMENEQDVELCFSWFNLMPLPAKENQKKHDKIIRLQIIKHLENLENFGVFNEQYFKLCATHLVAGNTC
jgi:hypothetical protein